MKFWHFHIILWDWILFKPVLIGFFWHCSKRESCCFITAKWKQESRFPTQPLLTLNAQAVHCCWAGVGDLAPYVVSSDTPVVEVLLLLGESRSPDSSQFSSDTIPVRRGREALLLMGWRGSPGVPRGLAGAVLTLYLAFPDTSRIALFCLCTVWWGWKSRLPTWLLLTHVWHSHSLFCDVCMIQSNCLKVFCLAKLPLSWSFR